MEEKKKVAELSHQLTLTNRAQLALEGVNNLGSYNQEQIILETSAGVLEIKGEGLHIQQLNLDQGKVLVDGEIVALIYNAENHLKKGKSFLGRLFK